MSRTAASAFRLVMRCYPKDFRDEYGEDMTQLFLDRQRHGHTSAGMSLAREVRDAASVATAMRWEKSMKNIILIATAVALVVVGAVVTGAWVLIPVAVLSLVGAFVVVGRPETNRPIDDSRRWVKWIVGGAVAITPAIVILVPSDEELSEVLWTLMAASVLVGIALLAAGLVLAITHERPSPTRT